MLGREVYQNPYLLSQVDSQIFGLENSGLSRHQVVEAMYPYIEAHLEQGGRLQHVTRHMLGLFQGCVGARAWRRHISENAHKAGADLEVLKQALDYVDDKAPA
jgi:tRNA-dihydrouridine synthase A